MKIRPTVIALLALLTPAAAAETAWQDVAPDVRLRLVAEDALKPDGTTLVGLEIDMPPGTKTYWRVPGETGIPTRIEIAGSDGFALREILWPYPTIDTSAGFSDYVYFGPTVLPFVLSFGGEAATLRASVELGICSDICMPVTASFELPLAFATPDAAQGLRIAQAAALNPIPWDDPSSPFGEVSYEAQAGALAVRLLDERIDPLSVIADAGTDGQLFGAPQKSPDENLLLLPLLGGNGDEGVAGQPVQLTFLTSTGPYSLTRQVAPAGSTPTGR